MQRMSPTVDCHHLFVRERKSGIKQWLDAFVPPECKMGNRLITMLHNNPEKQQRVFTP